MDNYDRERPMTTAFEEGDDDRIGEAFNQRQIPSAPAAQPHAEPERDAAALVEQEEAVAKPSKKRRVLLTIGLLAAITGGIYYGYNWWTTGRFLVSTDDAYVKADMAVISAKVPGIIMAVPVNDNTAVREGDILAHIDDRDYKIALQSARAKLTTQDATIARLQQQIVVQRAVIEQAKAQLAASKASLLRAQADFERAQTLAKQEFGSKQKLDQARADRDQADASVKSAEAGLVSANANLAVIAAQVKEAESVRAELEASRDKADLDLSFTTVKAPFEGVVGNKVAQPGQLAQGGTRLLSLVPLDKVYIDANYKETQLANIRPGQPVEIAVDAAGGRSYRGVVESIAPASGSQYSILPPENATGNFTKIVQRVPVRIRVEGEAIRDGVLRPGLSVVTYVNTKEGAVSDTPVESAQANPAR